MPVILYNGSEEELMDTIEREFSWPPQLRKHHAVLSSCLHLIQRVEEEIVKKKKKKNKGTRVSATKEGPIHYI